MHISNSWHIQDNLDFFEKLDLLLSQEQVVSFKNNDLESVE